MAFLYLLEIANFIVLYHRNGREWIFADKRFPVLICFVDKYHFQYPVAECFFAVGVEK